MDRVDDELDVRALEKTDQETDQHPHGMGILRDQAKSLDIETIAEEELYVTRLSRKGGTRTFSQKDGPTI